MTTFRSFISPSIIAVFLAACSSKSSSNDEALKYLNESLESSRLTINKSTQTLLMGIKEKLMDPPTAKKAQIWYPRADLVSQRTNTIFEEIENVKNRLLVITDPNGELNQVKNITGEIRKLGKELTVYNNNLMEIDSQFSQIFPDPIKMDGEGSSDLRFFPTYLFSKNITVRVAVSLLNQIQTNVKIIENRMIQFCYNKIGDNSDYFSVYSAIIAINTMRAEPGARLEITAGVGAFSTKAQPKVTIDGKPCSISEDGAVHYSFKAPKLSGKYKQHVKIEFIDEIGKIEVIEKDISYSVIQ
jgi:hypothetical protein